MSTPFRTWLAGLTSKSAPVDADELYVNDTVAGASKRLTWSNVKATLKTYFDTLYPSSASLGDAAAKNVGTTTGTVAAGDDSRFPSGTNTGDETGARVATLLHAATAKTTLVDADEVNGTDSAASYGLIRTTWANVWTYIKSKADAVYQATLVSGTNIKTINGSSVLGSGDVTISGASAPLTLASGTITTSNPALTVTQTWNAAGVTFVGKDNNITDTASASGSLLERWQLGGADRMTINKYGVLRSGMGSSYYWELANALAHPAINVKVNNGNTGAISFADGYGWVFSHTSNSASYSMTSGAFRAQVAGGFIWSSTTDSTNGTPDTGFRRAAAGVAEVNNGTSGTLRDLKLRGLQFGTTYTVATLPAASTSDGMAYRVSDASSPSLSATVSGSGSTKCVVRSNGTNWIVTELV